MRQHSHEPARGLLFVVSAPSGVGKTTLIKRVLPQWPNLQYSVSCTTRKPRPGEVPGIDYHFLSREDFLRGIQEGRFLEWAEVHGELYGTHGALVETWLASGRDVLLDIDVQGARKVLSSYPEAHTLFILPPSMEVLRDRLERRGTEPPDRLLRRFEAAKQEIQEAPWYEFIVVNDDLDQAVQDFSAIIRACKCGRNPMASRVRKFVLAS